MVVTRRASNSSSWPDNGTLTVYDIARRIGGHFRKAPERVYLHAGTRTGARVFDISGDSFDPKILPYAFLLLAPSEIETASGL